MPRRPHPRPRGQAALELVAIVPALAVVALVCWWIVAGAHAWSQASGAARAGARGAEVGASVDRAARSVLPPVAARGAEVVVDPRGRVRVRLAVPRPLPFLPALSVAGSASPAPGAP